MLTRLTLKNFKCFDSASLQLAPLTLLTGFNAAGKSTSLQSLLLLAQSLQTANPTAELPLNGPLVGLGTPGEVLNAGSGEVHFGMENDQVALDWSLRAEDRTQGISMRVVGLVIKDKNGVRKYEDDDYPFMLLPRDASVDAVNLVKRIRDTIFLSAVRMGTADVFPSPVEPSPVHAGVGVQGEYAPWWFHRFLDEEIDPLRCHESDQARTLRRQFNAWADKLFPGAQANALSIEKANLMRLELRIGETSDWCRPSNIGYGLTYAFPVIVAGLLAQPGQILIIDSPEAHLHPMGQSKMGYFLAKMAAAGVQVIIETHSDHVLNGIRLAVKQEYISPDRVAVHFFKGAELCPDNEPRVISPLIDKFGNLSEWPTGFFDQAENDLADLAGWN